MSQRTIAESIRGVRDYLRAHPDQAQSADAPATATMETGLRCRVVGPSGQELASDMIPAVGGAGSAPSPGWLLRAAHAACDATVIAMRAAEEGIELSRLEVTVGSESDDRGLLGADDAAPAGPLHPPELGATVPEATLEHELTGRIERDDVTDVAVQVDAEVHHDLGLLLIACSPRTPAGYRVSIGAEARSFMASDR